MYNAFTILQLASIPGLDGITETKTTETHEPTPQLGETKNETSVPQTQEPVADSLQSEPPDQTKNVVTIKQDAR